MVILFPMWPQGSKSVAIPDVSAHLNGHLNEVFVVDNIIYPTWVVTKDC